MVKGGLSMKGSICLIKISNSKVVPALCLEGGGESLLFAQIRTANNEDVFNSQSIDTMRKQNRGKQKKDQVKIRAKHETNTVYIGKPPGLKAKSIVMITKKYKINQRDVVKKIAEVSMDVVRKCFDLINQKKEISNLQKELQILKKKIQFAQINNQKYTQYELRIDQILEQIGYPKTKKKKKRPYLNYREVPYKGYIKVYRGGR
jgi:hypothetical protein